MNIVLWIMQVLLAFAFMMAGGMKLVTPIADMAAQGMAFVEMAPSWLVRFIGLSEVAGALGLILPSALRLAPKLTPLAAALLSLVMVLAVGTHLALIGDGIGGAVPALVLALLSGFVAYGRWALSPIPARGEEASPTDTAGQTA
ncbi:MAG: DoxX family protein [Myxococcota bacterium]